MAANFWPTPQDYNEAVQNPSVCFQDADLRRGIIATNALGLPKATTGAFASVYKLVDQECNRSWAVRCFLTDRSEQKHRYQEISRFVLMDDLECTIDFHYLDQGIKVRNEWYPLLKMPWVTGDTLDCYLAKNYKDTELVKDLINQFHKLVAELRRAEISHGDLQHGNILVSPDGLRLVDYDGLFVPALAGSKSLEIGHPNYQHPKRSAIHYDKNIDNFSMWLIYTALLATAIDPSLYERYCNGDDCLLFRRHDLAHSEDSPLFAELRDNQSEHLRTLIGLIESMLWADPGRIPHLNAGPEELAQLPSERSDETQFESHEAKNDLPSIDTTDLNFVDNDKRLVEANRKAIDVDELSEIVVLRTRRLLKKFQLWFSPTSWVDAQMKIARDQFDNLSFTSALDSYLEIYRVFEELKLQHAENYSYFWCLLRLGCCYFENNSPLAANYFLLASKNAPPSLAARAAIYLAVSRLEANETNRAMAILETNCAAGELAETVRAELPRFCIARQSVVDLLLQFSRFSLESNRAMAAEALVAAWDIWQKLLDSQSIAFSSQYVDTFLELLPEVEATEQAQALYLRIAKSCISTDAVEQGHLALLCATLQKSQEYRRDLPIVKEALALIARSSLKRELDVERLARNALVIAQADVVKDVLSDLSRELIECALPETAESALMSACRMIARANLVISDSFTDALAMTDGNTMRSLLAFLISEKAGSFKQLVLHLGSDSSHMPLLTAIAMNFLQTEHMSRLLAIVAYGCPDDVFIDLCQNLNQAAGADLRIELLLARTEEDFSSELRRAIKGKKIHGLSEHSSSALGKLA